MQNLIIIRGPPAAGKTHITNSLASHYLAQKKLVATIHWDDVLYYVRPYRGMDDDFAIKITQGLVGIGKEILKTREVDVFIIDGVFVLPQEHFFLEEFARHFGRVDAFRLVCATSELLKRNLNRAPEDFLEESRVKEIAIHQEWEQILLNEKIIDTSKLTPEEVLSNIILTLEKKEITNLYNQSILYQNDFWKIGDYLRYRREDLVYFCDVPFYKNNSSSLTMLLNFDIPFSEKLSQDIIGAIVDENYKIKFKYMNEQSSGIMMLKEKLKKCEQIEIVEEEFWKAPILTLPPQMSFKEYTQQCSKRLKRTINKYLNLKNFQFYFKTNDNSDVIQLWQDFLSVDARTWKVKEYSHMQALQREDLKYCIPTLMYPRYCSLVVAYDQENTPQAYSLMARSPHNFYWYAIKWGAADEGRKNFMGIATLFWHIEFLERKKFNSSPFTIDFWGRNQELYNQLKNEEIDRHHFSIQRKITV